MNVDILILNFICLHCLVHQCINGDIDELHDEYLMTDNKR